MRTVVILALAQSHATWAAEAAETFNHDFYTTIATVIPVLFLAIAVQSPMYNDLLKSTVGAWERIDKMPYMDDDTPNSQVALGCGLMLFIPVAILAALTVVLCGVLGEIQALRALNLRHAEGHVLGYTIVLLLATAVAPVITLVRSVGAVVKMWAGTAGTGGAADAAAGRTPMSRKSKVLLWLSAVLFLAAFGWVIYQLFFR
jgi:hypothetical protein